MRTQRLTRARDSGRESAETLTLEEHLGVVGDEKSEKDGSVSLLSGEAEAKIRSLGGLCTAKFQANIITAGLDYGLLAAGTKLAIAQAELEITRIGKPCYETCALAQIGKSCPLPHSCAFARVTRGGIIQIDDEISLSMTAATAHIDRSGPGHTQLTGIHQNDREHK